MANRTHSRLILSSSGQNQDTWPKTWKVGSQASRLGDSRFSRKYVHDYVHVSY